MCSAKKSSPFLCVSLLHSDSRCVDFPYIKLFCDTDWVSCGSVVSVCSDTACMEIALRANRG